LNTFSSVVLGVFFSVKFSLFAGFRAGFSHAAIKGEADLCPAEPLTQKSAAPGARRTIPEASQRH
jgi:hypothetical protein